jgi:hypothetical protein
METVSLSAESRVDGPASLKQLPPEIILQHLVKPYLSPVDVAALQSTCRHLHALIALTPIDPPQRIDYLSPHAFRDDLLFGLNPVFNSSPKHRRRIHSCQVFVECRRTGTNKCARICVLACQRTPIADVSKGQVIAQSAEISSCGWARVSIKFVPCVDAEGVDPDSRLNYFLVVKGSQVAARGIYLRTFLYNNASCKVSCQDTVTADGREIATQELGEQYRSLASLATGDVVISELLERTYCMSLLLCCMVVNRAVSESPQHGRPLVRPVSLPTEKLVSACNLLRSCEEMRANQLRSDSSKEPAIHQWISAFVASAGDSLGVPQSKLPALETILTHFAETAHKNRKRTNRPPPAPDATMPGGQGVHHGRQPPRWNRFRLAAIGLLVLGSSLTLIRCVARKRR